MRIGAHESVAGGLHTAFGRGQTDGCESLQIFTGFNTRWAPRQIDDVEASLFRSEAAAFGLPLVSHCCYLINLASPDEELWQRSIAALVEEMERCELLGIPFAVLHPGSHMARGEGAGLGRAGRALGEAHRRTPGFSVQILLENTAGQGSNLGYRFAHLGRLLHETHQGHRLGVCVDTCHGHAAGYDLASAEGYGRATEELEREVGLDTVQVFHLNDCRRPRGSRVDRHASVGDGTLGRAAFRRLVNDPRFCHVPGIVETPPEPDGSSSFARNIRALKGLRALGGLPPGARLARCGRSERHEPPSAPSSREGSRGR
jgi:deoxyribonuclease-4